MIFLQLYEKYINPVAETFTWVLMADHFNVLVRIREERYYKKLRRGF